ncbi:MAG TPA: thioredoxin [Alphaproteobacteria bacterium]|nr:thioredoxin [Alphaproteobacteria bacterium]
MANVASVNDTDFDSEVLNSKTPVVVDFWAEWCGPCKALSPLLENAAANAKGVKVVKMNIEENLETPTKFGIRSIPTLMAFKDGQLAGTMVGLRSQAELETWLGSL